MINESVLDGGGHLSPAGIVGSHTLSLLLLSHTAHDRTEGNPHTHVDRDSETITRGYSKSLDRGV